jgi:hypothetical protein
MAKRLIVVVVAVVLFSPASRLKGAGPYVPFMGVIWSSNHYQEIIGPYANVYSLTYPESRNAVLAQHIVSHNMSVVLQFGIENEAMLRNTNEQLRQLLIEAKQTMAPGLAPRIAAIYFGDEWFVRQFSGGLDDPEKFPTLYELRGNRKVQAETLRDYLTSALAIVKQEFGASLTMLVDPWWNDLYVAGYEHLYHPAPANVDILGMDPYFGHGTTAMRSCDSATKAAWDGHVVWLIDLAISRYPSKPIALIGQAFKHENETPIAWPDIPAPCQLEWWYQAALSRPNNILALLWFAWEGNGAAPPYVIVRGVREFPNERAKIEEIFVRNYLNRF